MTIAIALYLCVGLLCDAVFLLHIRATSMEFMPWHPLHIAIGLLGFLVLWPFFMAYLLAFWAIAIFGIDAAIGKDNPYE